MTRTTTSQTTMPVTKANGRLIGAAVRDSTGCDHQALRQPKCRITSHAPDRLPQALPASAGRRCEPLGEHRSPPVIMRGLLTRPRPILRGDKPREERKPAVMGYLQNLTRYFRQSLIDTDRACPDDRELLPLFRSDKEAKRDTPYLALAHQAWLSGQMAAEQAEAILSQRQSRSKKPLAEVELVMFPRVDLLRSQGGAPDRRKRRVLLPLGVFVRLDRRGQLRPAAKAPWIPREWLGPNQGAAEPIADVVAVDAFISTQPFEGIETWRELVGYCTRMLCSVTGAEYVAPDDQQPGTSLFELAMNA